MGQSVKVDKVDRRLLYELETNCRQSLTKIAKKIGVSKQVVLYKIRRLKKAGVIQMFSIVINESMLGYMHFELWMQLSSIHPERRKELEEYLYSHGKVTFLATTGPPYDLLFGLSVHKISEFYSELKTLSQKFPGLIQNHFVTITGEAIVYPRSYLLGKADDERKKRHLVAEMPETVKLDEVDVRLLNELSWDSRMPTLELAKKLRISPTTIRSKMKRLKREGVIEAYRAVIEPTLIGVQPYELLIMSQNMDEEKELETYCRFNPNIIVVLRLIGRWDIDILFDAETPEQYKQIIAEIRTRFGSYIKEYSCPSINRIHRHNYLIDLPSGKPIQKKPSKS